MGACVRGSSTRLEALRVADLASVLASHGFDVVDRGNVGGPTHREAQRCMEMIADTGRLGSLDVMELDPALDVRNQTAVVTVDLLESLFGKSTLVRRREA